MKPAQGKASFLREIFLGFVVVAFGLAAWGCASSGSTTLAVTGSAVLTGSMASARANHTATLLNNGKVLIAGGASSNGSALASAELYDPTTTNFTPTGSMRIARYSHTATLLNNGKVLIAGGVSSNGSTLASAELYDPAAGTFTPTGSMATARALQTASRLNNGLVLFAGGFGSDGSALASAELYDSTTGAFTPAGNMTTARTLHTATRLNDGLVLLAGGSGSSGSAFASAELYDPATGAFTPTGSMATARTFHTATLLNGGMVLLAGGFTSSNGSALASAERYDPATGAFTPTGNMTVARGEHMATLLTNGTVLVAGGKASAVVLASEEIYDPISAAFTATGSMKAARDPATATLLTTGSVLIAGGNSGSNSLSTAEIYQPHMLPPGNLVSITVSPSGEAIQHLPVGASVSLTAIGTFSNGSKAALASVIWSSNNTLQVAISNGDGGVGVALGVSYQNVTEPDGTILPVGAVITASVGSVSGSTTLFTFPAAVYLQLEGLAVTYKFPLGTKGQYYVGFATSNMDGLASTTAATWTSSAPAVVTISPGGIWTTVGPGSTTIKAVIGTLSTTVTMSVQTLVSVAVKPANPSIPFAPGETQLFTATAILSDGNTDQAFATWTSSAPGVATISEGLARFVGQGSTNIQATFMGITGSSTLRVVAQLTAGFTLTGDLGGYDDSNGRHTATLLKNGKVLIAGGSGFSREVYSCGFFATCESDTYFVLASASLYDPATGLFTPTGSLSTARADHTATLLNNGKVLIVGGHDINNHNATFASAELLDPATGTSTPTGNLNTARYQHMATLLNDGKVLIAGGAGSDTTAVASAELYDPATGLFTPTGSLSTARADHTATLLNNGMVLVAGGKPSLNFDSGTVSLANAELYDPATGLFTPTGSLSTARADHTATLLNNGKVLITGGYTGPVSTPVPLASAQLYDPATGIFTSTGSMTTARSGQTATLLNDGLVLVVGGIGSKSTAELYDSTAGTFTPTGSLNGVRYQHTATLLNNGMVLMVGGGTDSAELYLPATLTPAGLVSIAVSPLGPTISQGTSQKFTAIGTFTGGSTQQLASVTWSSSNTTVAAISNDVTNEGAAFGTATGATTIRAGTGSLSGSTTLTVTAAAPTAVLVSIAVTPANPSIPLGTTQQFTATGTYSDSSIQNLTSAATWTSSATGVATINAAGLATSAGQGSTTIKAAIGSINGSTTLTVIKLVSIAVTPANPSIALGATQQFTATGTYSDSSTRNLTSSAAWTSSATGVATISATGLATSVALGATAIQASFGGFAAAEALTVTSAAAAAAPVLTSLVPANAMAGGAAFSLTVNGSNFTAASTVIWNGSSRGTTFVSSTQLTAFITPPDIATAGMAQVTVSNPAPSGASAAFLFSVMGTLLRVSVASDGTEANSGGYTSSISGNGRYVSFFSPSTNLVTGDTNGQPDIFLADTCTGAPAGCTFSVTRVSVANNGTQANGFNQDATMSADGRFVAFNSTATNLVLGITRFGEIYVRDTCTGGPAGCVPSTVLVTAAPNGAAGSGVQQRGGAISGDGRYVAFSSDSTNLIPSNAGILVRDTCFGAPAGCAPSTIAASVATDGTPGVGRGFDLPSMSADGRYVAFDYAGVGDTLGTGPSTAIYEVYLRDTCLGAPAGCTPSTRRVSVADGGSANNGDYNLSPSVSADGRYVAFLSAASNLVTGDTNNSQDAFVRDTCIGAPVGCTPSTTRVSVASDGTQSNNSSGVTGLRPLVISANGRFVAFDSVASNLVPNDTNNGNTDIFVRDTCAGAPLGCTPSTVSISGAGDSSPDPNSFEPSLSADGQFVTFSSLANNLVSGDTNVTTDVFLAAGFAPSASSVPTLTSLSPSNVLAGGAGFNVEIDGSGFVPGSVARWNGANRVTIFVSSTKLLIRVLASDMSPSGVANVTVFNPVPGGGTSTSLTFTLN